jgi:two-component system CheB/CheR fusion protein
MIGVISLSFPIVGVGFSADRRTALELFFANLSDDCGIAFVLVPHLNEEEAGALDEMLTGQARLPVIPIKDGMAVQPGYAYLAPADRYVEIINGTLRLRTPEYANGLRTPIDFFLRSLARDQGAGAIAIIMPGSESDGMLGIKEIRARFGMDMVLDESAVAHDGKPANGLVGWLADYLLPAERMPAQLLSYTRDSTVWKAGDDPSLVKSCAPDVISKIFSILQAKTGHDFSLYKKNTIYRRIQRRMHLRQMRSAADYVRCLESNDDEAISLFNELLIHVTSFFRDLEAFEFLKKHPLPDLLSRNQLPDFRVWAPGCSTGEEVYSLAILLRECLEELKLDCFVQIFGTDIDAAAIDTARAALYPLTIAGEIAPGRLPAGVVLTFAGIDAQKQ